MKIFSSLSAVLLLVVLMSTSLQAQFGIGVRAGVNFAEQHINTDDDYQSNQITGLVIGIPLELALSKFIALQPEINFQQRGGEVVYFNSQGIRTSVENEFNYLEIPLLLKVGYTSNRFSLAAVGGPSFSYALGGNTTFTLANVSTENAINFDDDDINRSDVNLILGAQVGLPLGPGKLMVDGRYNYGISDVDDRTIFGEDEKFTNRGFSLSAGYMITLGDY